MKPLAHPAVPKSPMEPSVTICPATSYDSKIVTRRLAGDNLQDYLLFNKFISAGWPPFVLHG